MKLLLYNNKPKPDLIFFPESTLLTKNKPFYYPSFVQRVSAIPCVMVRVNKVGKAIQQKFANKYYEQVAVGFKLISDEVLIDGQADANSSLNYSFENSTLISGLFKKNDLLDKKLSVVADNNILAYDLSSTYTLIHEAISFISRYMIVKIGDLVFIPLAENGSSLKIGETIKIESDDSILMKCEIK